jgi:signal transduction histidine kinase
MQKGTGYRLGMLVAIAVVLVNAWVAARSLQVLLNAQFWLAHSQQVLAQTEAIALDNRSADAAARGFVLTGNPVFEQRTNAASSRLASGIENLGRLIADNKPQVDRVNFLRQRAQAKIITLDAAIGARKAQGSPDIPAPILNAALTDTPDRLQSVQWCIGELETEEHRLLNVRNEDVTQARRHLVFTSIFAAGLDLILLIIAFELLVRAARSRAELAARSEEIFVLNRELTEVNTGLEARVAERTRELQVSNQELEAFSYSVSHDLRAPLRTIDGFSLALKEDFADCLNEEGQDYINRVRGGVQRMGQLIDALLQLSRVTRADVTRERVDLSQLSTSVYNDLKAADPERHVTFIAQPGILVNGDGRLLRIALENLIGNAWKFTSKVPDARIEFGSGTRDGETVYFIRDNGAGFDMQYVDRLFTAFQRLHGDRDFKGSGIGLATVSRIIRRHHGNISAESELGRGATFYFTLAA